MVRLCFTALCIGLLAGATAPAVGQRSLPEGSERYAPRTAADRRISLEQAVSKVQQRTGGRVLDARDQGGRYRIKVLTRGGEVIVVYVDPQTGDMR